MRFGGAGGFVVVVDVEGRLSLLRLASLLANTILNTVRLASDEGMCLFEIDWMLC